MRILTVICFAVIVMMWGAGISIPWFIVGSFTLLLIWLVMSAMINCKKTDEYINSKHHNE